MPVLRNELTERRIEAARCEVAQPTCVVCCTNARDTFLNCGHLICRDCSARLQQCPMCRAPISTRSRAFV